MAASKKAADAKDVIVIDSDDEMNEQTRVDSSPALSTRLQPATKLDSGGAAGKRPADWVADGCTPSTKCKVAATPAPRFGGLQKSDATARMGHWQAQGSGSAAPSTAQRRPPADRLGCSTGSVANDDKDWTATVSAAAVARQAMHCHNWLTE